MRSLHEVYVSRECRIRPYLRRFRLRNCVTNLSAVWYWRSAPKVQFSEFSFGSHRSSINSILRDARTNLVAFLKKGPTYKELAYNLNVGILKAYDFLYTFRYAHNFMKYVQIISNCSRCDNQLRSTISFAAIDL
jgi:hypothetical protein